MTPEQAAGAIVGALCVTGSVSSEEWRYRCALHDQEVEEAAAKIRSAIATATAELREQLAAAERRAMESQGKMFDAYRHLEYLWDQHRSCPCGARPESPNTHPHVTGCPTAAAIAAMKGSP